MTAKRFTIIGDEFLEFIMQDKLLLPIYDDKERLSLKSCCDLLNALNDENKQLKQDLEEYCNFSLHDVLDKKNKEIEQLKKEISIFEGEYAGHYQRWVAQIKKYVDESNPNFEYDEDFIIKIALSYTLQSLRNGESLKRFQWEYKELKE